MIEDAKNPKWADVNKTKIVVDVLFEGENDFVSFVSSENDCHDYGRTLYKLAAKGKFGEVADSDEERIVRGELPVPEGCAVQDGKLINLAMHEQQAAAELNRRLAGLNSEEAKAQAEIDEVFAAERKAKLAELLAVKQQPGWPLTVEWPGEEIA